MKFGLTKTEYELLFEKLINPLKKYGAKIYIFGSRATGKHKKFSDVDLLYKETIKPIPKAEIYSLLTQMEESSFPYKVDLVYENELAQSYKDNVNAEKIKI